MLARRCCALLGRVRLAAAVQPVGLRAFAQSVSAELVKQLRQRTGAPINKCKQALEAEGGDLEAAATWLRKSGIATAQKKASRGANDGVVGVQASPSLDRVVLIELNSETDFVARNEKFQSLSRAVATAALSLPVQEEGTSAEVPLSALLAAQIEYDGQTQSVEDAIVSGVASLGENLQLRRACTLRLSPGVAGVVSHYVHNSYVPGFGRTAAAVALEAPGASQPAQREAIAELGQKLAMHVVAAAPAYLSRECVPASKLAEEADVIRSQLAGSKKSAEVIEKITSGKLAKFFDEACLLEQNYVLDDSGKVSKLVAARAKEIGTPISVKGFVRYHLGSSAEAQ